MSVSLLVTGCATQKRSPSGDVGAQGLHANDTGTGVMDKKPVAQQQQEQTQALIADGTYEDVVSYAFHAGVNEMDVKVTVKDDVITEASVAPVGQVDPVSQRYIAAVDQALPGLVVGKRVEEVDIPHRVSGSSLTTAAFKRYLEGLHS